MLAKPIFYIDRKYAIKAAVAVITIQRDFGNRFDRKRTRLRYIISDRGLDWFREQVIARLDVPVAPPKEAKWNTVSDILGWHEQSDGKLFCSVWVEEGRIKDTKERQWRTAFLEIAQRFWFPIRLTTNCNIIFHDINLADKEAVNEILVRSGVPKPADLTEVRRLAQACVSLPTCGLGLAESERAFHIALDQIDAIFKEYGLTDEPILIRMTGCPNGCARPYNADIAFVGRAPGKYAFFI